MLDFIRKDPLNEQIIEQYVLELNKFRNEKLIKADDILINKSSNKIRNIALGLVCQTLFSRDIRGYLLSYDNLYDIGYDADSINILNRANQNSFGQFMDVRVLERYLLRYSSIAEYDEYFRYLFENSQSASFLLKKNDRIRKNILQVSQIVYRYDISSIFNEVAIKYDSSLLEKLRLSTYDEQVILVKKCISVNDPIIAEQAIWLAYHLGNRLTDFLYLAKLPLKNERDNSKRVLFFKRLYALFHYKDADAQAEAAASYLSVGEIHKACQIIRSCIKSDTISRMVISLFGKLATLDTIELLSLNNAIVRSKYPAYINELNLIEERQKKITQIKQGNSCCYSHYDIKTIICVTGQIRGINLNLKNLKDNFKTITPNGYLFAVWDTEAVGSQNFNSLERFIGRNLESKLPQYARSPSTFKTFFPSVSDKLISNSNRKITPQVFCDAFPNSNIKIFNEKEFDAKYSSFTELKIRGSLNQAKQFFLIYQGINLLEKFYDNLSGFDIIVRLRPDLKIDYAYLNDIISAAQNDSSYLYVSYSNIVGYSDQFVVGSLTALREYASLWPEMIKRHKAIYHNGFDRYAKFGGEALLSSHLISKAVNVRICPPLNRTGQLMTPLPLNNIDILSELEFDLAQNNNADDFKPFYDAYTAYRRENKLFL